MAAIIALSGSSPNSKSVQAMVSMLEDTGAQVVVLTDRDPTKAAAQLEGVDALVIMGNNYDIAPEDYGATPHPMTKIPDPQGDAENREAHARSIHEKALVAEALKRKLPMLGICGGMQRINTTLGGTLHQHIPDQLDHENHLQKMDTTPAHVPVQFVQIDNQSLLGDLATPSAVAMPAHGAKEGLLMAENSIHHQAVDQLGKGLKANAKSIETTDSNDIVEGFEIDPEGPLADQFVMGLQFHPEFGASDIGPKISAYLFEMALEYEKARKNGQQFDARLAAEQIRKQPSQRLEQVLTSAGKSDATLSTLHQLGVFRSIEELRTIPVEQIKQALSSAYQNPGAARAPPEKDTGQSR